MNRLTYERIDISRLYCSLLIVLMHCFEIPKGEWLSPLIIQCFAQQAVPFFFLTSGFFLGKKLQRTENSKDKRVATVQYAKKLFYLYFVWMILWLPKVLIHYIGLYGISLRMVLIVLRRVLIAGEGVYWYVLVLAESALVVGLLFGKGHKRLLMLFAAVGLILSLCYEFDCSVWPIDAVNNAFYFVFSWSNNFIMKGVPFFAIGALISGLKPINKSWTFLLGYFIVSIINVVIYCTANRNFGIFTAASLMYPIQAVMLFLWSVNGSEDNSKWHDISIRLRERSAVYYFLHTVFVYGVIDQIFGMGASIVLKYVLAISLCELSYWCIKNVHIKKINWLVNIKG